MTLRCYSVGSRMIRQLVAISAFLFICSDVVFASTCGGANRNSCWNIFTAKRCGVLNECVNIWRTSLWEKYRSDTSSKCTVCRTLAKNLPLSELKPLCSMLNTPDIHECENTITELPNTLRLHHSKKLEKERDIDILCNTLTACETDVYIGGLDFGSLVCDDCKKVVKTVQNFVADNATIDAIAAELNTVICDRLSDHVRDYCKQTVKVHVPVLLHLIEVHLDPSDICALLHLCPKSLYSTITLNQLLDPNRRVQLNSFSPSNIEPCSEKVTYSWINRPAGLSSHMFTSYGPLRATSDPCPSECQNCVSVINKMKESLKNPALEEQIKEGMEKEICEPLGFIREVCKKAIDSQFDNMIAEVEKVDSYNVCSVFQMCGPNATRPHLLSQISLQPSYEIPGVCQLCEIMMEKLIDLVIDNSTEESITATLEQICTLVPQSYRKRCDNFILNFGSQIVEAIIKGTAPKLACSSFGLCTGPVEQPVMVQTIPPATTPKGSSYCGTCKALVDVAYKQLLHNDTEEELKRLVKHVCTILPGSYASECENLVDEYTDVVIQYLEENLTPEEVCEKIGFCPDAAGDLQALCLRGPAYWCLNRETAERCNATAICTPRRFQQSGSHQLCTSQNRAQICASFELAAACGLTRECLEQRMTTYLQSVSHLLNIRPQIYTTNTYNVPRGTPLNCTICTDVLNQWTTSRKFLGTPFFTVQVCTRYANPVDREQCDRVWTHRYPAFRQLLRSNANPETVCTRMNLCRAPVTPVSVSPCLDNPFYAVSSRRAAEECGTLDLWTQLQQLETKPIRTETTPTPSRVIPVPDIPACRGGPDQFCETYETAQLCGHAAVRDCQDHVWFGSRPRASNRNPPLLGVVHCTWGPSYWCSSREAARSCGQEAVDYCIRQRAFA